MISENLKVGTNVFHLEFGIGKIINNNGDGTFKVRFEWIILPSVHRKNLTEIVD